MQRLLQRWFAKFEDKIGGAASFVGDKAEGLVRKAERYVGNKHLEIADAAKGVVDDFLDWVEEQVGDSVQKMQLFADSLRATSRLLKDQKSIGKAVSKMSRKADDVMDRIDQLRDLGQQLRDAIEEVTDFDRISDLLRGEIEKLEARAVKALNDKKAQAMGGV